MTEVEPISVEKLRELCEEESTGNALLEVALVNIINGHLLLQGDEVDPDHPNDNRRMVVVIFQANKKIPEGVQNALMAEYVDAGWRLEFGQDWRSGGPWIICRIKDTGTQEERMAKITTKFKELGHNMSEWREEDGRYFCKCDNHGCELDIMFSIWQRGGVYFVGQFPMQRYHKCPAVVADI